MKTIVLSIILAISFTGNSKDSLNYSNQKFSIGVHSQIFDLRPHIAVNFKRHQIGAGIYLNNSGQDNLDYGQAVGGLHAYPSPDNFRVVGFNLHYRVFPFKPRRIISFFLENYIQYSHRNFFVNGSFHQKNRTLSESILAGLELKFLGRFSFFLSVGPALDIKFAKDRFIDTGSPDQYEVFTPLKIRYDVFLGVQIGIK